MPVTVTVRPPSCRRSEAALGTVSAVAASARGPAVRPHRRARPAAPPRCLSATLYDHAGGKRQHLFQAQPSSRASAAQVERARQPVGTGAGVGIAGIDEDRLHLAARSG
jgi:hypothetical protein